MELNGSTLDSREFKLSMEPGIRRKPPTSPLPPAETVGRRVLTLPFPRLSAQVAVGCGTFFHVVCLRDEVPGGEPVHDDFAVQVQDPFQRQGVCVCVCVCIYIPFMLWTFPTRCKDHRFRVTDKARAFLFRFGFRNQSLRSVATGRGGDRASESV